MKNKMTRGEKRWGAAEETSRYSFRRVVLFCMLPLWASLEYPIEPIVYLNASETGAGRGDAG